MSKRTVQTTAPKPTTQPGTPAPRTKKNNGITSVLALEKKNKRLEKSAANWKADFERVEHENKELQTKVDRGSFRVNEKDLQAEGNEVYLSILQDAKDLIFLAPTDIGYEQAVAIVYTLLSFIEDRAVYLRGRRKAYKADYLQRKAFITRYSSFLQRSCF